MHGLNICIFVLRQQDVNANNQPNNDGEPLHKKKCASKQLSLKIFFKPRNTN